MVSIRNLFLIPDCQFHIAKGFLLFGPPGIFSVKLDS